MVDDDGAGFDGALLVGELRGRSVWAVDVEGPIAGGLPLRNLWGTVDDTTWALAGRAVQLVEWQRTHRFCGRCGTPTEPAPGGERARHCPACGLLSFPRLAPAVIVLVERGDGRALLARSNHFPFPMFSCIAGFVEPGETLEEAVAREVAEEVGIAIKDVRYWGSQPWPFPHSLMIGFTAQWAGGDITPDGDEIAEAAWFSRDDLPTISPPISIARRLIDDWIARSS